MRGQSRGGRPGDSRCTPSWVWELALRGIGQDAFDTDPATNDLSTVPARNRYTGSPINGLTAPWHGHVWLNPPFSDIGPWARRVVEEAKRWDLCSSITVLVPGDSSTVWWQTLAGASGAILALNTRPRFSDSGPLFEDAAGSAPMATHLIHFGPAAPDAWGDRVKDSGLVLRRL